MKTKFIALVGRVEPDSSFINIKVENGDNANCIGDQIWYSPDGTEMEVNELSDGEVFEEMLEHFEPSSRQALRGALRRMGVTYFQK